MSEHPKELFADEKWDRLIDLSLRRTVYGLLGGSLVALALFREWCQQAAGQGWPAAAAVAAEAAADECKADAAAACAKLVPEPAFAIGC